MVEAGAEAAALEEDLPALERPPEAPALDHLLPPPRAVVRCCCCLLLSLGFFSSSSELSIAFLPLPAPAPTPASRDVVEPFDPSGWTSFVSFLAVLF